MPARNPGGVALMLSSNFQAVRGRSYRGSLMEVIRVTFSCACAGIAKIWNALIANKRAAALSYFTGSSAVFISS